MRACMARRGMLGLRSLVRARSVPSLCVDGRAGDVDEDDDEVGCELRARSVEAGEDGWRRREDTLGMARIFDLRSRLGSLGGRRCIPSTLTEVRETIGRAIYGMAGCLRMTEQLHATR
ncbi:hypothetical protein SCHPADRAFT_747271 [Schizopora paradoxa]|uniref:Uncharacterized protein n=1 Tax=Schizopora paradoxa TaxID=27342 RepID=A0A0H2R0B5_9AGAM|nr:hypothetical protein SCHPADRAFT_747271 [Schizopora paradoxa]